MTDLSPTLGTMFGEHYRVERTLGAGGMATVYLAEDVRHRRRVAIKVLHAELSAVLGPDRFLKEIELTASLQHPHILPLFDSGSADGRLFYVMPFVEGETLRARLERERQLPVADAVRITREVADALGYAHARGVVHRDIKPENILLHDGHALVADFGIALAVQQAAGQRLTQTGLSLGTPQYMSPEQAMGERAVDARSDIYSLGAVLYEMLTGDAPFTGSTVQALVAKVLTERPTVPSVVRDTIPRHVEAAALKALAKLPADRFSDARSFAGALGEQGDGRWAVEDGRTTASHRQWRSVAIASGVAAVVFGAALVASVMKRPRASVVPTITARLTAPPNVPTELRHVALSPDGATLAFVSDAAHDGGRIWLRRMNDGSVRALAGTEGARGLFWSPDGSAIGFFSAGWLRVTPIQTAVVRKLAPASNPAGGAWTRDGHILYSPFFGRFLKIPASGGEPVKATAVDPGKLGDREPSFLPDGRRFLFWRSGDGSGTLWVGDLETGQTRELLKDISSPHYVEPGYLLFFHGSQQAVLAAPAPLMAQRFDVAKLALIGEPTEIARVERPDQVAIVTATRDLLLVREPLEGDAGKLQVFWLDRATGRRTRITGAGTTWSYRISPDGRRVAFGGDGLWMFDPDRDVSVRVPTSAPFPLAPVWSPDGKSLAVLNGPSIMIVTVDGTSAERSLIASEDKWVAPMDWTRDGTIYYLLEPKETRPQWELWRVNIATTRRAHVPTGPGNVVDARVSPDGGWIAWESDASGRREIYLAPIGGSTAPSRVSKNGGGGPQWRRDGRELFFVGGDGRVTSVSVQLGASPVIGEPKVVNDSVVHPAPFLDEPFQATRFAVSPDGGRLLMQVQPPSTLRSLTLIQGWQQLVR
jgi:serine/threonine-protein kinase